jgi:hypothetical protein
VGHLAFEWDCPQAIGYPHHLVNDLQLLAG